MPWPSGGAVVIVRVLPRQGGKTTEMIRLAAEEWLYIVAITEEEGHRLYRKAIEAHINIPYPITWDDFVNRRYYSKGVNGFLIDNLDMCVQSMTTVPVRAVTLTGDDVAADRKARLIAGIRDFTDEQWRDVFAFRPDLKERLRAVLSRGNSPWIPADPDGLPPRTYPQWRAQEQARRDERS